jgi:hypothetical protein
MEGDPAGERVRRRGQLSAFSLSFRGATTAPVPVRATAAAVKGQLEALSTIGSVRAARTMVQESLAAPLAATVDVGAGVATVATSASLVGVVSVNDYDYVRIAGEAEVYKVVAVSASQLTLAQAWQGPTGFAAQVRVATSAKDGFVHIVCLGEGRPALPALSIASSVGGTNAVAAVSACTRNLIQTITTRADSAARFFNGESTADLPFSASAVDGAARGARLGLPGAGQQQRRRVRAGRAHVDRDLCLHLAPRQEDAVESALFALRRATC